MKTARIYNNLIDFLYPRLCPGCMFPLQQRELHLCMFCLYKLPKTKFVSGQYNPLELLFRGRLHVQNADAWLFFRKQGITQHLMHALKYKGDTALGQYLGHQYGKDLLKKSEIVLPEMLTSVPLHPAKLKRRGFNQSDFIAEGISDSTKIPFNKNVLTRTEDTSSQTKKKRYDRWENASGTFALSGNSIELPRHVGIVDDVITTGATLEACANVLLASRVEIVSIYTLCLAIN